MRAGDVVTGALGPKDPVERVLERMIGATGTSYHTPTVNVVDLHVAAVQRRLAWMAQHQPSVSTEALRRDLRMLLARREWLELVSAPDAAEPEPAPPPAAEPNPDETGSTA